MTTQTLSDHMSRCPCVAAPTTDLREALRLMRDQDVRHLPVVDNDHLVGIVSLSDVREAIALPQAQELRLDDVMKSAVYAVSVTTPLEEVVSEMAALKCGSVVVVNRQKEVVGVFTTTDALELLSDLLTDSIPQRSH